MSLITKDFIFPFAIKWEINEKHLNPNAAETLKTERFNAKLAENIQFWFELWPKEYEDDDMTSIYIHVDVDEDRGGPPWIKSEVTYSVKAANFSITGKNEHDEPIKMGITVCDYDELVNKENGYIVDGILTFEIIGTLSLSNQRIIKKKKPSIVSRLGTFLWNRNKKDFKIIVGDEIIKAHKCVLQSRSPVFDKMLEKTEMKEAKENKVEIPDFNFEVIKNAIAFLYDRDIDKSLSLSNRMLLLQFSDKYDIQDLKETTEHFLIDEIDASNVSKISNYSIITNSTKLRKECFEFLMKCSKKNIAISDFDILDKDFALEIFKYSFYRIADYS